LVCQLPWGVQFAPPECGFLCGNGDGRSQMNIQEVINLFAIWLPYKDIIEQPFVAWLVRSMQEDEL